MTVFDWFVLGLGYGACAVGLLLMVGAVFMLMVAFVTALGKGFGVNDEDDEDEGTLRERMEQAQEYILRTNKDAEDDEE